VLWAFSPVVRIGTPPPPPPSHAGECVPQQDLSFLLRHTKKSKRPEDKNAKQINKYFEGSTCLIILFHSLYTEGATGGGGHVSRSKDSWPLVQLYLPALLFLLILNILFIERGPRAYGAPGGRPDPRIRSGCPLLYLIPSIPHSHFAHRSSDFFTLRYNALVRSRTAYSKISLIYLYNF
jgi:hypothetical protein